MMAQLGHLNRLQLAIKQILFYHLNFNNMPENKKLDWETLIIERALMIPEIAKILDVNQKYLMLNTDFINAVLTVNIEMANYVLIKAAERLKELKNGKQ